MRTGFAVKKLFFDRQVVIDALDRATRKIMSRFGAHIRSDARQSIRRDSHLAKSSSKPGKPPHSHLGLLRDFIFFSYGPETRSVIIGPERLPGALGDAPHALEYGGPSEMRMSGKRRGRDKNRGTRRIMIAARPYMGPAAVKNEKKLAPMFAHSIKP